MRSRLADRPAHGDGRVMGDLALASGRAGAQLRDRHHDAERTCAPTCTTGCRWCSSPSAWPAWLGEEPADLPDLKALLAPYPYDDMIAWPVSQRVGNVKNNDPSLIEPVAGIA